VDGEPHNLCLRCLASTGSVPSHVDDKVDASVVRSLLEGNPPKVEVMSPAMFYDRILNLKEYREVEAYYGSCSGMFAVRGQFLVQKRLSCAACDKCSTPNSRVCKTRCHACGYNAHQGCTRGIESCDARVCIACTPPSAAGGRAPLPLTKGIKALLRFGRNALNVPLQYVDEESFNARLKKFKEGGYQKPEETKASNKGPSLELPPGNGWETAKKKKSTAAAKKKASPKNAQAAEIDSDATSDVSVAREVANALSTGLYDAASELIQRDTNCGAIGCCKADTFSLTSDCPRCLGCAWHCHHKCTRELDDKSGVVCLDCLSFFKVKPAQIISASDEKVVKLVQEGSKGMSLDVTLLSIAPFQKKVKELAFNGADNHDEEDETVQENEEEEEEFSHEDDEDEDDSVAYSEEEEEEKKKKKKKKTNKKRTNKKSNKKRTNEVSNEKRTYKRTKFEKKSVGPRPQQILCAETRDKFERLLETLAGKHELLFNNSSLEPDWPKFRGYWVGINEVLPNISGTEAKNADKRRAEPQLMVLDLCGHEDSKTVFQQHFKLVNEKAKYKYTKYPAKILEKMKED
jgi:hypothetical protein